MRKECPKCGEDLFIATGHWCAPKEPTSSNKNRGWIELSDAEITKIAATPAAVPGSYVHSFARAIESALKEKNT